MEPVPGSTVARQHRRTGSTARTGSNVRASVDNDDDVNPMDLARDGAIDEEALIAEFEAEKPARHLSGIPAAVVKTICVALSLFVLYWVFNPMPTQFYLPAFLMFGLSLTFLVYRGWGRSAEAKEAGQSRQPATSWTGCSPQLPWSRSPTSSRTGTASSAARSRRPTWTWSWACS